MLCAIGLAIGFRANVWNIGAEGQFILGAVAATGVALYFGDAESALVLPAMVLAGAAGGRLGGDPGRCAHALQRQRDPGVADAGLCGPALRVLAGVRAWKDPDGFNFPQTRMFAEAATLPMVIEGTRLHFGFAIALAALVASYAFMNRSHAGFRMRVAGEAADAARYAGFSATRMIWVGLLSAAPPPGWPAWARWPGRWASSPTRSPAATASPPSSSPSSGGSTPSASCSPACSWPCSTSAASRRSNTLNLPNSISMVFQGMLLFFFLLGADVFIHYRLRLRRRGTEEAAMDASLFTSMLFATVVAGTLLIIVALGLLVNEKAGVLNLGAEGMMAMGAVAAFAVTHESGKPWLGVAAGMGAGMAMAALFGLLVLTLMANQVASGLAWRSSASAWRPSSANPTGGGAAGGAADPHPLHRRPAADRRSALQPAGAGVFLLGAVLGPAVVPAPQPPGWCCARWASRPHPRTRSATR